MNRHSIEAENSRMRKFVSKSTDSQKESKGRSIVGDGGWFGNNKRLVLMLFAIVLVALFLRVFYSYGISVGSGIALSGGSSAEYHLSVIENLVATGQFVISDLAVNYPYGGLNVFPPLMDVIVALFAWIATAAGVPVATASAAALSWFAPIVGTLAVVAAYYLGVEMYNKKVGVLAALFLAVFPLMISGTVFSNGTESAFYLFLFIGMLFFLVKAVKAVDATEMQGYKAVFADRAILKPMIFTIICFVLIALTWNGFYAVVLVLVAIMVIQALLDRFRGKDFTVITMLYAMVLLIGICISAAYYVPAGLWNAVFSGPFIVSIMAVVFTLAYTKVQSKPWIITIPVFAVIIAAIFVALYFAAPALFNDVVFGNSIYGGNLFGNLIIASDGPTLSQLGTYYGWATFWFPMAMLVLMAWGFRKNMDSRFYVFMFLWYAALLILTWVTDATMFLCAPVYAIGAAALIVKVLDLVDIRGYFASFKGVDFKSFWKKLIKPAPFIAVLVGVFLVAMPGAIYAVDASISNNEKSDYNLSALGAAGYYVDTTDANTINNLWNQYSSEIKTGALVTWTNYANTAAAIGGFPTVTSITGGGASAASNIMLANGSAGATAAMAVRMIESKGLSEFQSILAAYPDIDYAYLTTLFTNEKFVKDLVIGAPDVYGAVSTSITFENARYLAVVEYLTSSLSEPQIDKLYDAVCAQIDKQISYIAVNGSMLHLYYNDGSSLSTMAYLNDYAFSTDGSVTKFYSYGTSSPYYCTYTSAMYETFLWKSIIGMSPADVGISSGISYLSSLALSDGTYKAHPGYGLSNYSLAYWHVMYNADKEATLASEGWVDMDAYEAMALQESEGGLINYIAGTTMFEYRSNTVTNTLSGKVTYDTGSSIDPAKGIQVAVFEGMDTDGDGNVDEYMQRCTTYTNAEGKYEVSVSNTAVGYKLVYSAGTKTMTGGVEIKTLYNPALNDSRLSFTVANISMSGQVLVNGEKYVTSAAEPITVQILGASTGYKSSVTSASGAFTFNNVLPDSYTITVVKANGNTLVSTTYKTLEGHNSGIEVETATGKITVTVTDDTGNTVNGGSVVATDTTDGQRFYGTIENGTAVIQVIPGKFTISAADGYSSVYSTSVTVASSGSKTASLTVYKSVDLSVTVPTAGMSVTLSGSDGFTMSASSGNTTTAKFAVPISVGAGVGNGYTFTLTASNGDKAGSSLHWATWTYSGSSTASVSLSSAGTLQQVTGTLKDSSGTATAGTVLFYTADGKVLTGSAGSDGAITALLPSGTYTMYAFDGSDSVILKKITVGSAVLALGDVTMSDARKITSTLNYSTYMSSSTSKTLRFLQVNIDEIIVGEETFSFFYMTNSSGKAIVYIPSGSSCTVNVPAMSTSALTMEAQANKIEAGTSNSSKTYSATTVDVNVKCGDGYTVHLDPYSSTLKEVTVTPAGVAVRPGQYTAKVEASSGYYYTGTVYIYPGMTSMTLDITPTKVNKVTISGLDASDVVDVKPLDGGSSVNDEAAKGIWYVESGYSYYFKITASNGNIAYLSADNVSADVTFTGPAKTAPIKVTGFVGVAGTGDLVVEYGGVSVPFSIKGGVYTATLPTGITGDIRFTASVANTVDGKTYYFDRSVTMASNQVTDGLVLNLSSVDSGVTAALGSTVVNTANDMVSFSILLTNTSNSAVTLVPSGGSAWSKISFPSGSIVVPAKGTYTLTVANAVYTHGTAAGSSSLSVSFSDAAGSTVLSTTVDAPGMYPAYAVNSGAGSFSNGVATFGFTVTNNLDVEQTVLVDGGSAWKTIDFTLSGASVQAVTVPAKGTVTVVANATYDAAKHGMGDKTMSVILSSVNGDKMQTMTVDTTGMIHSATTSTVVDSSLGTDASSDAVNGYEYMYAVTLNNKDNFAKFASLSVTGNLSGWYVTIMDAAGTTILDANGGSYKIPAFSTETVYVKVMSHQGAVAVPSLTIAVTVTDGAGNSMPVSTTSSNIAISGNTATMTQSEGSINVSVKDPSASGTGIYNSAGNIPTGFWILLVVSVMLLFLVLYLGMRRGVFTRRK